MPIHTEHQIVIQCDIEGCFKSYIEAGMTRKWHEAEARKLGWTIGDYVFCPKHANTKTEGEKE